MVEASKTQKAAKKKMTKQLRSSVTLRDAGLAEVDALSELVRRARKTTQLAQRVAVVPPEQLLEKRIHQCPLSELVRRARTTTRLAQGVVGVPLQQLPQKHIHQCPLALRLIRRQHQGA